ncbi:YraN family protein [Candidatus Aerophobetes bacterium]|nr:YraN family protein [Candidatus Aerophobetes bacterium]
MDTRKDVGKKGEQVALSFLRKKGYKILDRNFRCRFGELDIVAEEDNQIIFIEVRSCRSLNFGSPLQSLDYFKKKRLTRLALFYLTSHNLKNASCRFDVVAVVFEEGSKIGSINLIKNAFVATF